MYSNIYKQKVINLYFVQKRFTTGAWDLNFFKDCLQVESPEYCNEHSSHNHGPNNTRGGPRVQFLSITNISRFRELCGDDQKDADDRFGGGKAGGGGMGGGGGGGG